MTPVGTFSKLRTEVAVGSVVSPLKYHEEETQSRCVTARFPVILMYTLSAVAFGNDPLNGVSLMLPCTESISLLVSSGVPNVKINQYF